MKKRPGYTRVTLDIPDDVYVELVQMADKDKCTIEALILRGIDELLKEKTAL